MAYPLKTVLTAAELATGAAWVNPGEVPSARGGLTIEPDGLYWERWAKFTSTFGVTAQTQHWFWDSKTCLRNGYTPVIPPLGRQIYPADGMEWQVYLAAVRATPAGAAPPGLPHVESAFPLRYNGPFAVLGQSYNFPAGFNANNLGGPNGPGQRYQNPKPGPFWNGKHDFMPGQAGVFVGFRNKNRPKLDANFWEVVYAKIVNGKCQFHAYDYSYLGVPLTPRRGATWQAKEKDIIFVAALQGSTMAAKVAFVQAQYAVWNAAVGLSPYLEHRDHRNLMRVAFEQPPYVG